MSPLRWTTKSTRKLAAELTRQGHKVSADTVGDLLREEGFSLQGNAKTIEGTQHPDRDAQFRYISEQARAHQDSGDPVISVDTKKKELIGEFANAGREWRPKGEPAAVRTHDFPGDSAGKAIPYGIYDVTANAGWVNVGTDHDTAAFAVESIRRWWNAAGSSRVPGCPAAADHRRRGRLQRLPHPRVEDRAGRPGRRDRPGDHRLPLPARDIEVEQDRAPAVLPHHHELARPAADQPRRRHQQHRRDHHPHRPDRGRPPGRRHLPHRRQGQQRADGRPAASAATPSTATGTTPSTPPRSPHGRQPATTRNAAPRRSPS